MPDVTRYAVGDLVRCVENDSFRHALTVNELFVVHRVSDFSSEQRLMVRRISGEVLNCYSFRTRRFVLVPPCPSLFRRLGLPSA